MTSLALLAMLFLAGQEKPPVPTPQNPPPSQRRVDLRFGDFQILADRMQGRIDTDGSYLVTLSASDRSVELQGLSEGILLQAREASLQAVRSGGKGRPDAGAAPTAKEAKEEATEVLRLSQTEARWAPARPIPGKAGRHIGDSLRLSADVLEIRRMLRPEGTAGSPDRHFYEAKGRIRISGKAFSLSCEEVRWFPERRCIALDRVSDVRLSLGDERGIPPVMLSTDKLSLGIDLDLRDPYEVVLSHPEGFDAEIDDARLRLRTLILRLKK